MSNFRGYWKRNKAAKIGGSKIEVQLGDANMSHTLELPVDVPAVAALPSTFTTLHDFNPWGVGVGTEVIVMSGVPFKVGSGVSGTWVWLAVDSEQSTESTGIRRTDRLLVRIDPAVVITPGEKAYIIPASGLVTNLAAGNDEIGVLWTKNADKIVFAGGVLTGGYLEDVTTLADGTWAWMELNN